MNRLLEIGFEPAGHWLPNGNDLVLQLFRHSSQRNILYAFVSDGEVKYVGKTVQSLSARMGGARIPSRAKVQMLGTLHESKPCFNQAQPWTFWPSQTTDFSTMDNFMSVSLPVLKTVLFQ